MRGQFPRQRLVVPAPTEGAVRALSAGVGKLQREFRAGAWAWTKFDDALPGGPRARACTSRAAGVMRPSRLTSVSLRDPPPPRRRGLAQVHQVPVFWASRLGRVLTPGRDHDPVGPGASRAAERREQGAGAGAPGARRTAFAAARSRRLPTGPPSDDVGSRTLMPSWVTRSSASGDSIATCIGSRRPWYARPAEPLTELTCAARCSLDFGSPLSS